MSAAVIRACVGAYRPSENFTEGQARFLHACVGAYVRATGCAAKATDGGGVGRLTVVHGIRSMAIMVIVAIANHKGGVGKTATCHALGVVLAGLGWRVVMIDCDPQASLTLGCGVADAESANLAQVIGGTLPGTVAMSDVIRELGPNLWLCPSDLDLAGAELGLASRLGREAVLRNALASVGDDYDVALLDCPPSLGLLTVNALAASDAVLIPTMAQVVDLRGLQSFLSTVGQIRDALNSDLEVLGILVTFFDTRLVHHKQGLEAMEAAGLPVLPVQIGRSVRVAESAAIGQSVVTYEPRNPQADRYRRLGQVIDEWLRNKSK